MDTTTSCGTDDKSREPEETTSIDIQESTHIEHQLSFLQAIKLYPKAAAWSIGMSMALLMEGYDTKLLSSLFAQPAFVERYGHRVHGKWNISASWQTGLSNGSSVGQLVGLLLAGYLSERIGFRKTMVIGLSSSIAFIFMQFFAPSLQVLLAAQILFGITLGINQMVPVVYAKEVAPLPLHAFLTTFVNLGWILGHGVSLGVLRGVLPLHNQWAYKIPFAVQWAFPVILIPLTFLAPENPWWLVRCSRYDDAKAVLRRLQSGAGSLEVDNRLALMIATTEHERKVDSRTSYWACFDRTNLRRTVIVICCYCAQVLSGNSLRGYSTFFFETAGLPTDKAFDMSLADFGLSFVGTVLTWFITPWIGRRTIYLYGLLALFVVWIAVGSIGVPQKDDPRAVYAWAIGGLLVASSFLYDFTLGPIAYTLVAEIPGSLVRSKSAAVARWVYSVVSIVFSVITPYQLNTTAWNWGAVTGFWWAGFTCIALIYTFFLIPETKDRTPVELDLLFEKQVSARHFARHNVNAIDEIGDGSVARTDANEPCA